VYEGAAGAVTVDAGPPECVQDAVLQCAARDSVPIGADEQRR